MPLRAVCCLPAAPRSLMAAPAAVMTSSRSTLCQHLVQVAAPGGDVTVTTPSAPQGGIIGAYPAKFSDDYGSFVSQNGAYYAYLQVRSMVTYDSSTALEPVSQGIAQKGCPRAQTPLLPLLHASSLANLRAHA